MRWRAPAIRKLLLFNSHGGQPQVMDIVARDLRVRHGMLVVAYSWFAGGLPAGLFPDDEVRHGIHAGAIETSMMLHLRPDLVRMDLAADFAPLMRELAATTTACCRRPAPAGSPGRRRTCIPRGACGDATNADAERGRALVEHAAQALVDLLARSTAIRSPISGTARRTPEDGGPVAPRWRRRAPAAVDTNRSGEGHVRSD